MNEAWKTFDDAISALVGMRDMIQNHFPTYLPLLTEENTIQGWIDVCSEICEVLADE